MGILSKVWADGVLGLTASAVLTVASERAVGAQVRFTSEHNDVVNIAVTINTSGTSRPLCNAEIPAGGYAVLSLPDLEDGDVVSALADVDAVVHYLSTGGSQT